MKIVITNAIKTAYIIINIFIIISNIQATPPDNNQKEVMILYYSKYYMYRNTVSTQNLDSIFSEIESADTSSIPESRLEIRYLEDIAVCLPENIGNLKNLKLLFISHYKDSLLPENICNLSNLKQLRITYSDLTKLPDSIGKLSQLERIYFHIPSLAALPESFGNLFNLLELNIFCDSLLYLPESFGSLINLIQLNIQETRLNKLPESFGNLRNLEQLNLSNNKLVRLPASFCNLSNLISLDLSKNRLSQLPDNFANLTAIEYLYIDDNVISKIPDNFGNLINLFHLYLRNNQLSHLPESIGNLSKLNTLDISYNKITELPESFDSLNIRKLVIKRNPRLKMNDKQKKNNKDLRKRESNYIFVQPTSGLFLSYPQIVSLKLGCGILFETNSGYFGPALLSTVGINSIKTGFGLFWNISTIGQSFSFTLFDFPVKIHPSIYYSYFWKDINDINKKNSYIGFNLAIGYLYVFEIDFGVYKRLKKTDSKERIFEIGFGFGIFQPIDD